MIKRITIALLAFLSIGAAFAADPNLVKPVGASVKTYGLDIAIVADKDTSSGNRVAVRFPGAIGVQYIADDAVWSKYTVARNAIAARGGMYVGTSAKIIDVRAGLTDCQFNNSQVTFVGTNNPEVIADNCAFAVLVNGNAQ